MTNTKIVKQIACLLAEYGSGVIVYGIIKNLVATNRIHKKVAVAVATFAIAGYVGRKASKELAAFIDQIEQAIVEIKKNI